ncbi:MAG: hypothetical protein AAB367_00590 [Patescibacteria group bacterium]
MTSIHDLSWGETSFLAKLELFLRSQKREKEEKLRSVSPWVQAQGYSALSSIYYSIVGTATSQRKAVFRLSWLAPLQIIAWLLTWLPLAAWCYWRMLSLSDRVVKLIGYDDMSADQCDIRQSILRRRIKYGEAEGCIRIALAKKPEKAHTRGLLHVGLADIYRYKGERSAMMQEVESALAEAREAEGLEPRQASRIYRHCADIVELVQPRDLVQCGELRRKARELAEATGAEDQLLKL